MREVVKPSSMESCLVANTISKPLLVHFYSARHCIHFLLAAHSHFIWCAVRHQTVSADVDINGRWSQKKNGRLAWQRGSAVRRNDAFAAPLECRVAAAAAAAAAGAALVTAGDEWRRERLRQRLLRRPGRLATSRHHECRLVRLSLVRCFLIAARSRCRSAFRLWRRQR